MPSTLDHPKTMETTQSRHFVRSLLPWIVGAAMLVIYLVTLDRVVTVHSIASLTRATGDDWRPVLVGPLTFLVNYPVRWLPAGSQLFGMNFISALCAALSLALLARSVALLPHDRTQFQRDRQANEHGFLSVKLAWVPVLFAVVVVGLQRSFWEHAIVGTGEALDLLLFAYCVRCLLEYRVEQRDTWLYKLAVVYSLGITNNFAMIAFFPALLTSLIWIKGLRFFRFEFLSKMFLLGLAGLLGYLVLPALHAASGGDLTFWQALKQNVLTQKMLLLSLRHVAILPGLFALGPLLLIGIRWPSSFGDQTPIGSMFANFAGIILHVALLVACVYIAFDPPISPRAVAEKVREDYRVSSYVFLPTYFLGALSVGYFAGFLLLVFSVAPDPKMRRRPTATPAFLNATVPWLVCAGAAFTAGKLWMDNYPAIRRFTDSALHDFGVAKARSLPNSPVAVLADDPLQLHTVRAASHRRGDIFIDTTALMEPAYYRFLEKRYGADIPKLEIPKGSAALAPNQPMLFLNELTKKRDAVYVHPSFGMFFETYYLQPRGLAYLLKPLEADAENIPELPKALLEQQLAAWRSSEPALKRMAARLRNLDVTRSARMQTSLGIAGQYLSRDLVQWGVELQRLERFEDAHPVFSLAAELNPDNASALINRRANEMWRDGKKRLPQLSKEEEEKLNQFRADARGLLVHFGPIDEPSFSAEFANLFLQVGLNLQARHYILRGLSYVGDDIGLLAALANVQLASGKPDHALTIVQNLKPRVQAVAGRVELARVEASAYMAKNDLAGAERVLQASIKANPGNEAAYTALAQLHISQFHRLNAEGKPNDARSHLTNALQVLNTHVKEDPKSVVGFFNRGYVLQMLGNYLTAADSFSAALRLQPDNSAAFLNRAVCYLQAGKLDDAKRDYRELLQRFTQTNYRVYYGLGEIAYQQKDWRGVRDYYEQYLKYAPETLLEERKLIRTRLDEANKNL
jgi:tetratricopeptide (TPR) repeat protein